jgi:antitoxin component YwqK of YwqJK toxin-antitoxin module
MPASDAAAADAQGGGQADVAASLPKLDCPDGATEQIGRSANGIEQWCDREGVMHGPYQRYHDNMGRAVDGGYEHNMPDGSWTWYHEEGTTKSKGNYRKGKQAGSWTWWHPNGLRAEEGDFLAGRRAGQWTSWYDDGRVQHEGQYHNGNKDAEWRYYQPNTDQKIERTEVWEKGILRQTHAGVDAEKGKAKGKRG